MTTLIMLCGQGSAGKSTFSRILKNKLFKNDAKIYINAVDDIVGKNRYSDNPTEFYHRFLVNTQQKIDEQCDIIILDFAFDVRYSRQQFLNQLRIPDNEINFIGIRLAPPVETIIKWHCQRCGRILSPEEENRIKEVYNSFEELTIDEFKSYNFNSIQVFTIDPSKIPMEEMKNDK